MTTTITKTELRRVLADHAGWLSGGGVGGGRADLQHVDLRGAALLGGHLPGANLQGSNLQHANLRYADLRGANLQGSNLQHVDLIGADLRGACFRHACLRYTHLQGSSLQYADLRGADLWGADFQYADLRHVMIDQSAVNVLSIVPGTGPFEGWKKCRDGVLVRLLIPAEARRSNAAGRKCRAEFVVVQEVIGAEFGVSFRDETTRYAVGHTVTADAWEEDRWIECCGGIHFYLTRVEAEEDDTVAGFVPD